MTHFDEIKKLAKDLEEKWNKLPWMDYHDETDASKKRIDTLYCALRAFNGNAL